MSMILEDLCVSLGCTPLESLRRNSPGDDVSLHGRTKGDADVVIRFSPFSGSSKSTAATGFDTRRWNTSRLATGPVSPTTPESGSGRGQLMEESALRWSIGAACGGMPIAPVLEFGQIERFVFQIRPFFPLTLRSLVEKQVNPNPLLLFRIVDQIWAALAFLHQSEINQPHGNLSLSNVAFGPGPPAEADLYLIDLRETLPETKRAEVKRTDFQNLGLLIYRLASSFEGQIDAVDALVRSKNAAWSHLGKFEQGWRELTGKLLDPEHFPSGTDLAAERQRALAKLRPPKTQFREVANIRNVGQDPPIRAVESPASEKKRSSEEIAAEIEILIERSDLGQAMDQALQLLEDDPARSDQIRDWFDRIATEAGSGLYGDSQFLAALEQAARSGSAVSALRLGENLVDDYPGEALAWLEQAAAAGQHNAVPLLAHIFEWGGDGIDRDPPKALEHYRKSMVLFDDPDLAYRAAAMILREESLAEHAADAIKSLDTARSRDHFRAADLLGQCCAHGIGMTIDEKRAFELFTEAWNHSKKSNDHYHTASNNLGVCFAIGFGTRKDPDLARHYFKQGEIAGHEASKKNLQSLLQDR